MHSRRLLIGALSLGVLVATPAAAEEQAPTAQAKATARSLADEGWNLYTAGRYEEALEAFSRAEAKVHAPTFLLMMARASNKLGKLLEARALYKRIAEEKLAASATPGFVQAQTSANEELALLAPRIPALRVVVTGAPSDAIKLTLDGSSIEPSSFVERNPGDHVLTASMAGRRAVARTIHLTEWAREQLTLDASSLAVEHPSGAPAHAAAGAPPRSAAETRASHAGVRTPAQRDDASGLNTTVVYAGMALAGVAAVTGSVFGIVSLNKESEADDMHVYLEKKDGPSACANDKNAEQCGELLSTRKDASTYTKAAWGCFGGAAAVGAATLIYYWTAPRQAQEGTRAQVIPHLGLAGSGILITGAW
ncbi:hypothetical protein [Sorangium sp. So ce388]|uniref:hypothetical protein n=1 Tax=Sorangium sp. So ce388 TaxID=3133309 RepID=UPI003F5C52C3